MPKMSKKEINTIVAQAKDWSAWGRQFNWTVYGYWGAQSAGFHRDNDPHGLPFTITRGMRDDIDSMINQQETPTP